SYSFLLPTRPVGLPEQHIQWMVDVLKPALANSLKIRLTNNVSSKPISTERSTRPCHSNNLDSTKNADQCDQDRVCHCRDHDCIGVGIARATDYRYRDWPSCFYVGISRSDASRADICDSRLMDRSI